MRNSSCHPYKIVPNFCSLFRKPELYISSSTYSFLKNFLVIVHFLCAEKIRYRVHYTKIERKNIILGWQRGRGLKVAESQKVFYFSTNLPKIVPNHFPELYPLTYAQNQTVWHICWEIGANVRNNRPVHLKT